MSRGMVTTKLARLLWAKCIQTVQAVDNSLDFPDPKDDAAWETFVAKVNRSLDGLDLELRALRDQLSGREMYALVNRKGDQIAQMATDYTAVEIAYFKAIVEQIMLAPREAFSVSSLVALREVNEMKTKSNMSKAQAEVVLGSFVAKGWLCKSKRGRYSLSTRTLLELQPYLKSTYPDEIVECTICMEMVTKGVACYTTNCKTRMHTHCFDTYRRRSSACPSCNKDWPRTATEKPLLPVGEDALKDGQEDGKRRTRRTSTESDEDDEEEGEGDDEEGDYGEQSQPGTQAPSQPKNQRAQRSRKAKAAEDTSMEVDGEVAPKPEPGPSQRRRSSRK